MNWLSRIFKNKSKDSHTSTANGNNFHEGYRSFKDGLNLYLKKDYINALNYFDKAIEMGYYNESYIYRGCCLRELEYYYDAIEDFDKAISNSPNDCNIYYDRYLSKRATRDFRGAVADLKKAVELSKVKNEINAAHNETAINMGFKNITDFYKTRLVGEEMIMAFEETGGEVETSESENAIKPTKRRGSKKLFQNNESTDKIDEEEDYLNEYERKQNLAAAEAGKLMQDYPISDEEVKKQCEEMRKAEEEYHKKYGREPRRKP